MTRKTPPKKKAAEGKKARAKKKPAKKKSKAEEAVVAAPEPASGVMPATETRSKEELEKAAAEIVRAEARRRETETIEPPAEQPSRPERRSGAGLIGWLSLILSIAAVGAAAYLAVESWRAGRAAERDDAAMAGLSGTLDATRASLDALGQRFDSLAARDLASVGEMQALERRLNERLQAFESLPGRIGNLEGSISSLQGISSGARDAWLLAEAEYYMQIANAQLQLAGNPHLAALALSFADERLLQLANPALTEVRRALSDELRAIEIMDKPDIEGLSLTLASLAAVVDSLPLRQEVDVTDDRTDEIDPNLSGFDRALASLKKTASDIVSVRRTDEVAEPLVAPDAVYFLRANLALQLQAARLALLRSEQEIFEQSLDDAADWLAQYYDTESAPVQSALATIGEIRNDLFAVSPPDISESLRLLRQYVTLSESTPPADTEPEQ